MARAQDLLGNLGIDDPRDVGDAVHLNDGDGGRLFADRRQRQSLLESLQETCADPIAAAARLPPEFSSILRSRRPAAPPE